MHGCLFEEDLCRSAPDHDLPIGLGLELGDVVADLVCQVALVLAGLDGGSVEALDVVLVEDAGERLDGLEKGLDLGELVAIEHLRVAGGVVKVAAENIPAGEDQVVELCEGNEVLDQRRAALGALAEPDGAHLRGGADRFREASANGFDAGDQGGGDGSHAWDHDAKFSGCWFDLCRFLTGGFGNRHLWCGPSIYEFARVLDRLVSRTERPCANEGPRLRSSLGA